MPPECIHPEMASDLFSQVTNGCSGNFVECSAGITPWSTDIWSVGAIWLEMISGVPLWLSYPAKVIGLPGSPFENKDVSINGGLFAIPGKIPDRIVSKQMSVISNLEKIVNEKCFGVAVNQEGLDLLRRMLAWRPKDRISPSDALKHPFLNR
eukprot:GDKK01064970.1.p1 GENE.GDKK01064970.1~~GDKK01064970.1.p1  ORF type:complete len:152 (+),score=20.53 GDKK01064970.1:2-457(+)